MKHVLVNIAWVVGTLALIVTLMGGDIVLAGGHL